MKFIISPLSILESLDKPSGCPSFCLLRETDDTIK